MLKRQGCDPDLAKPRLRRPHSPESSWAPLPRRGTQGMGRRWAGPWGLQRPSGHAVLYHVWDPHGVRRGLIEATVGKDQARPSHQA